MAIIVTQTADNAYHIQDAFRRLDRDGYPLEVYQAIYDYINETHDADAVYELDVIAWCCDLSETTLDALSAPEQNADEDDLYTLDDLADYLHDVTTVLYVDYDAEVIYHLAY